MQSTIAQIDTIRASNSRAELGANFQTLMAELGFEWCNVSVAKNMADPDYDMLTSNWPDSIRRQFHHQTSTDHDFSAQVPPAGMNFTWDEMLLEHHRHIGLIAAIADLGIKTGAFATLSTFDSRPYKLVIGSKSLSALSTDLVGHAIILATVTLMRLQSLGAEAPASSSTLHGGMLDLSETQDEILRWAAEGKSNVDIAAIMGLKTSAVSYHLARIYKILGVATKLQAVAFMKSAGAGRTD